MVYEPIPAFSTSDHKPVRSAFIIGLKNNMQEIVYGDHRPAITKIRNLHISFTDLQCHNLHAPIYSTGGEIKNPDPYVIFVSNPPHLIRQEHSRFQSLRKRIFSRNTTPTTSESEDNSGGDSKQRLSTSSGASGQTTTTKNTKKGWPSTSIKRMTSRPDWGKEQVNLVISHEFKRIYRDHMLFITVMHNSRSAPLKDIVIGTCQLNLQEIIDKLEEETHKITAAAAAAPHTSTRRRSSMSIHENITFPVDEPLLRHGKIYGRLVCNVSAWWLGDAGPKSFQLKKGTSVRGLDQQQSQQQSQQDQYDDDEAPKKCCCLF